MLRVRSEPDLALYRRQEEGDLGIARLFDEDLLSPLSTQSESGVERLSLEELEKEVAGIREDIRKERYRERRGSDPTHCVSATVRCLSRRMQGDHEVRSPRWEHQIGIQGVEDLGGGNSRWEVGHRRSKSEPRNGIQALMEYQISDPLFPQSRPQVEARQGLWRIAEVITTVVQVALLSLVAYWLGSWAMGTSSMGFATTMVASANGLFLAYGAPIVAFTLREVVPEGR